MTGKQLASAIRRHRGKISVPMLTAAGVIYVFAEKSDLAACFDQYGDHEVGLKLVQEDNGDGYYLGREPD